MSESSIPKTAARASRPLPRLVTIARRSPASQRQLTGNSIVLHALVALSSFAAMYLPWMDLENRHALAFEIAGAMYTVQAGAVGIPMWFAVYVCWIGCALRVTNKLKWTAIPRRFLIMAFVFSTGVAVYSLFHNSIIPESQSRLPATGWILFVSANAVALWRSIRLLFTPPAE